VFHHAPAISSLVLLFVRQLSAPGGGFVEDNNLCAIEMRIASTDPV
jgi:hypothetical protein